MFPGWRADPSRLAPSGVRWELEELNQRSFSWLTPAADQVRLNFLTPAKVAHDRQARWRIFGLPQAVREPLSYRFDRRSRREGRACWEGSDPSLGRLAPAPFGMYSCHHGEHGADLAIR